MSAKVHITLDELVLQQAEARGFSFLPRQPVHSLLSGRHASRLRGRGLAFEELRHYQPGDDIRTIDWRATARLRSTQVRVYNEERERPVLLVVDQRRPMFFGSRRAMKSVAAAEIAALSAWRSLQSGDRIGGIIFNEQEIVNLRPHRSQTRVLRLLHEVVRLNAALASSDPPDGTVSLNEVLEAVLRRVGHDYLVVLVSDLDGANDDTRRLAARLAAHNDVLVVAVYDPVGAVLRAGEGMVAVTAEGPVALPSDPAFTSAFQETFSALLDHWTEIFRTLRVPVLPISAAEPPAAQLRALFGRRLKSQ
jgi:uncharacterized protein (DUF58 family)